MFKAAKMPNRQKLEKQYVHDKEGKPLLNRKDIYKAMKSRFENHLYSNIPKLSPFEVHRRPLNIPITLEGDHEDTMRRKQLSIVAMNNMGKVWIRKYHISETH